MYCEGLDRITVEVKKKMVKNVMLALLLEKICLLNKRDANVPTTTPNEERPF